MGFNSAFKGLRKTEKVMNGPIRYRINRTYIESQAAVRTSSLRILKAVPNISLDAEIPSHNISQFRPSVSLLSVLQVHNFSKASSPQSVNLLLSFIFLWSFKSCVRLLPRPPVTSIFPLPFLR